MALVARTDILIGVHGAGLTLCVYQRRGALVVQLNPTGLPYWEVTLFHRMATLAGVTYYDWTENETGGGARGVAKPVIKFHFNGANDETEPRDVRTFVTETLLTWADSAHQAYE